MVPRSDLPSTLSDGRYVLGDELGHGGMAVVVKALDTTLSVERAVKIVFPQEGGTKALRRRLRAEAKAMARIHHPNILGVHDIGSDGGLDYVVMDLAASGSLQDRIDAGGPLPPAAAVSVIIDVLGALALAHSHGIVHRDVKPHNILLDVGGRPLLADFGIALLAHDLRRTRAGATMGSLAYMPPEQRLDAASVGPTADIYAAGATLYALLTGDNPVDLFLASPESARWGAVPDVLRPLLLDAVSAAPELRWQTAGAMAEALLDALESGKLDGLAAVQRRVFAEPAEIFSRGSAHFGPAGETLAPLAETRPVVEAKYVAPTQATLETLLPEDFEQPVVAAPPPHREPHVALAGLALLALLLMGSSGLALWFMQPATTAQQARVDQPAPEPGPSARAAVPPAPEPDQAAAEPDTPPTPGAEPSAPADAPAPGPAEVAPPADPAPAPAPAAPTAAPAAPTPAPTVPDAPPATSEPATGTADADPTSPWGTWEGSLGGVLLTVRVTADGRGSTTTQFGPNQSTATVKATWSPDTRTLVLRDDGTPPAEYALTVSPDGRRAEGTVTSSTHRRPVVLERP